MLLVVTTKTEDPEGIFTMLLLLMLLMMITCSIVDVVYLGSNRAKEEGGGMIMGGSGIGGVQWSDYHDDNDNAGSDDPDYMENELF